MNRTLLNAVLLTGLSLLTIYLLTGGESFSQPVTESYPEPVNFPLHLKGCRTFDPPVPARVIYPTVSRNFVSRLCALEVFPSYGAMAFRDPAPPVAGYK